MWHTKPCNNLIFFPLYKEALGNGSTFVGQTLLLFSSPTYHISPLVPSSTVSNRSPMNTTNTTSMDTIKLEKLQAMKKYRIIQLFQTVFQYCLTFMVVILCLSKSVWFMSLCSAIKAFFLFTLPRVGAYVMTPKCLFVICIIIVVILVGESKMVGSASSSDLYDDYVRRIRSQSLKSFPVVQHQVGQQKLLEYSTASRESQLKIDEENDDEDEHEGEEKEKDAEEEEPQDQKEDQGEEEEEREEEEEEEDEEASEEEEEDKLEEVNESNCEEEEDDYLLTEELNRRVQDFIAKVNRQRRIEADMMLCGG